MNRSYKVVDVFTRRPLLGNPVAVVLDAEGLSTDDMQAIARWTNLSETTFVLPSTSVEADYELRIFTPGSELPFAGHPTLGSAHAILEAGRVTPRAGGRLIQSCGIGLVELSIEEHAGERHLAFDLPKAKIETLHEKDRAELAAILGCDVSGKTAPAVVNVGPVWVIAQFSDAASVLELRPDLGRLADFESRLGVTGVTVFGAHQRGDAAIEVRTFAPSCGVNEDPVCGSGNGSVAAFQWSQGLLPADGGHYVATQGRCVGRDGRIEVSVDRSGKVRVGGSCVTCVDGSLMF
ncbi:PhzF family phenazine biosynthesis protein [Burkholderia sp. Ac-20365]|jgi:PhzF family phenazine biosynthesis protein|uniref:PhzF family phenazine biosynthesis protein n=1 Tax=Burkholderia sp. Ac-20365 TaxID=2703897 RepID=UPI00197C703A|nr:PhzF family phenazine biosynthesis protein [Burkholderia sp. Ac-20365]MBN3763542.1 PhzF family phenazine biosynthesis protein [Burkholderia sp. Ac-20365]